MSTKATIRQRSGSAAAPGFHLYEDLLDTFSGDVAAEESPVYLQLDQVGLQLETRGSIATSVTLTLPSPFARELGLLPSGD